MPWTRTTWILLAALLGGCRSAGELVVVNGSDEVVTALFGPDGSDLLAGRQLPPGTFVHLELPAPDTATPRSLEAYTTAGACARHPVQAGRWELDPGELDPAGC